ncbi:Cadherin domain containing protein [Trichuris trichiura]|uniref:Cadherin domain containing protein n=1 Tax=Trichuris trichiura TaxID=36087 RepID=A0A077Z125_TRITR|nr:Cadherin domain containing protein [Trichuris trichiura]
MAHCYSGCIVSKNYSAVSTIEIDETIPAGTRLISTTMEPAGADLGGLYIEGSLSEFYADKFMLKSVPEGQIELITNGSLYLPKYPFAQVQVTVNVSVLCNRDRVSLAAIQINAANRHAPEWYGLPYEMKVAEDNPLNVLIKTPIICVDWDPATLYNISFEIDALGEEKMFSLTTLEDYYWKLESLPTVFSLASNMWERNQLPRIIFLRLLKRLDYDFGDRVYRLNIIAKDNPVWGRQRVSMALLTIHVIDSDDLPPVLSSTHYFGSVAVNTLVGSVIQISPVISARDGDSQINAPIIFSLQDADPFWIDENTGTIFLNSTIPYHMIHSSMDVELKATQRDNPKMNATAKVHFRFVGSQSVPQLCRINVVVSATMGAEIIRLYASQEVTKFAIETEEEKDRDLFYLEPKTDRVLVRDSNASMSSGRPVIFKIVTVPLNSDFVVTHNGTSTGVCSAAIVAVTYRAKALNNDRLPATDAYNLLPDVSYKLKSMEKTVDRKDTVDAVVFVHENETPANIYQFFLNITGIHNVYFMVTNPEQRCCYVDPHTGWMSVTEPFDYEVTKDLLLNVSGCYKRDVTPAGATCHYFLVQIIVIDQNDNYPVFNESVYEATIAIYAEQRTRVIQVFASDRDAGQNGLVSYALKRSVQPFTIDYNTGWVLTSEVLSEPSLYNFTIVAFDHGVPSRESYSTIIINVTDCHTWPPRLLRPKYSATVPEDIPVGSAVVQIGASVPFSSDERRNISYRFASNASLPFTIDPITGIVRTTALLDFESTKNYTFLVQALNHGVETRLSNPALVNIYVTDVNDNAPVFGIIPDRMVLPAFVQPGNIVLNISATDADSDLDGNNAISYELIQSDNAVFQLDGATGRLTLAVRPADGDYAVTLVARDHGQHSLNATHTVRFRFTRSSSSNPAFCNLHFYVQARACLRKYSPLKRFHAVLANSSAVYELLPAVFGLQMDNVTGILFSTPEFCSNFSLTKKCIVRSRNPSNESLYSDVPVTICVHAPDVKRMSLEFIAPVFYASVSENTPANQHLGFCVALRTSLAPHVTFSLEKNELFLIKADGCIVFSQMVDLESLSSDQQGIVSLKVFASDGISTAATLMRIKVEDINEFAPQFDHHFHRISFPEDCAPGTILLELLAKDEDATDTNLTYSLLDGEFNDLVEIDHFGRLIKSPLRLFDRELEQSIRLRIMVTDKGNLSDTATVEITILDVNDNPPHFLEAAYSWLIMEGPSGVGSRLGIYCRDPDEGNNGTMSFRLLPESLAALFHVQKEAPDKGRSLVVTLKMLIADGFVSNPDPSSMVSIALLRPLDREERSHLFLLIEARDHGTPTLISAARLEIELLDINDNAPSFAVEDIIMSIPCEMAPGIPFAILSAVDMDINSDLTYQIVSDDTGMFHVDAKLALLSIEESYGQLTAGIHRLTVAVTDGIFKDNASATIDVRCLQNVEKAAVASSFHQLSHVFNVYEGNDHSFVGKLQVNGSNNVDFTVIPFHQAGFFQISQAGEVYTNTNLTYRKDNDTVVFAVSLGVPSSAELEVLSTFLNFHFPMIVINSSDFHISSGRRFQGFTSVAVQIMDINDHPPVFQRGSFFEILPLSVRPGHPLSAELTAVDSFDEGVNAKLLYELKGKDASCFHIDPDFGRVTTVCDFVSSAKRRYEFFVFATDQEGSGLSSTANVSISLVPVEVYLQQWKASANRVLTFPLTMLEAPRSCRTMLVADHVTVNVPRNAALGTAIFILSSLITEQGRRFFFRFASKMKAKEMPVALDEQHDLLIVSKPLAKVLHDGNDYVVPIVASQISLRLFCPIEVTIRAIGTYDNHVYFKFTNRLFSFSIDENMPAGSLIGHLNHSCPDLHKMSCKIVSFGHESKLGLMLTGNASLLSTRAFDREQTDMETLILVEGSCGEEIDFAAVKIVVNDVNDNAPKFRKSLYTFSIPEGPYNNPVLIGYVSAYDVDRGGKGEIQYAILEEGKFTSAFMLTATFVCLPFIVRNGGGIYVSSRIDREMNDTFNFTVLVINFCLQVLCIRFPWLEYQILAFDHGLPTLSSSASVLVSVVDVNDNAPIFDQLPAQLNVTNGKDVNITIGRVHAFDLDSGLNGVVTYDLIVGQDLFSIDQNGMIKNKYPLANIASSESHITVRASDLGRPSLSAEANISILLEDNCESQISSSNVSFLSEHSPKLLLTSRPGRFAIHEITGQLYTTVPLDRENQSLYVIVVQCSLFPTRMAREVPAKFNFSDLLEVGSDSTLVIVSVLDENDNSPHFEEEGSPALFYLKRPETGETCEIGFITAVDPDTTSVVSYFIENSATDDSSKFLINRETGLLSCANWTEMSDGTDNHHFSFTVTATDSVHSTRKEVAVIPIAHENAVKLSVLRGPDYVASYKRSAERRIEEHVGFFIHLDEVRPLRTVIAKGSEIDVYAVDKATLEPVKPFTLYRRLEAVLPLIQDDLKHLRLLSVETDLLPTPSWESGSSSFLPLATIDVTLICVITVVAIISVVVAVLLVRSFSLERERTSLLMSTSNSSPVMLPPGSSVLSSDSYYSFMSK